MDSNQILAAPFFFFLLTPGDTAVRLTDKCGAGVVQGNWPTGPLPPLGGPRPALLVAMRADPVEVPFQQLEPGAEPALLYINKHSQKYETNPQTNGYLVAGHWSHTPHRIFIPGAGLPHQ